MREPACRPAGSRVSGSSTGEEAEPRDQRSRAFCSARQQAHGAGHALSLGHCAAGRGGLLRAQWTPCQPSAGPCPLPIPGASAQRLAFTLNLSTWNHEFVVLRGLSFIPHFGSYSQGPVSQARVWPHLLPFLLVDCLGHTWLPLGSSGSESLNRSLSEVKVCRTWRAERQLSRSPWALGRGSDGHTQRPPPS